MLQFSSAVNPVQKDFLLHYLHTHFLLCDKCASMSQTSEILSEKERGGGRGREGGEGGGG